MSCKYSSTCGQCQCLVKSTAIEVSGDSVVITIPEKTFHNGQPLCVVLAQSIPNTVSADTKIILSTGSVKLTMLTPRLNFVYGDQLLSRKVLRTRVATDTSAVVLTNSSCVRCTTHSFGTLPKAPARKVDNAPGVVTK